MGSITLTASNIPDVYFFKLVSHSKKGQAAQMLDNQFVLEDSESEKYIEVEPNMNLSVNKKIRDAEPLNTLFACTSPIYKATNEQANGSFSKPFYKAVDGDQIIPSHKWDAEMSEAHDDLLEGKVPKLFETKKKEMEKKMKKKASKGKMLIDDLLAKMPTPDPIKDGFYVSATVWKQLLINVHNKENTLIKGPSGTGKTELAEFTANQFSKNYCYHDMGAMQDPLSGLLGVHRLNEKGVSEFDKAAFSYDIQNDGIVLLDEINRAPSNANNILFPVLDKRRELPMAIASSKVERSIPVNENCMFIATANMGTEYTGTNELDAALKNRFRVLEVDFMPCSVETEYLADKYKIDEDDAGLVCLVAEKIRNAKKDGSLSEVVSTRDTLYACSLLKAGFSLQEAYEMSFLQMFDVEEQAVVKDMFVAS